MRFQIVALFALVIFALVAVSGASHARKFNKDKDHPGAQAEGHAEDRGKRSAEEGDDVFGFNDKEVDVITGVLRGIFGDDAEIVRPSREFCPPGLAKKNNGCMPPGLAKKYTVGERLPENALVSEISDVLRDALGMPPRGKKYVQVDNDVLLIEEGTRLVLDAVGLKL